MPNIIEFGKTSDKGLVRTSNEDNLVTSELSVESSSGSKVVRLYAVADGMGGLDNGEIASQIALKTLIETLMSSLVLSELHVNIDSEDPESMQNLLGDAVQDANVKVFELGQKEKKGVGTTLTALLLVNSMAVIANVGDSRIYLLREGTFQQVTVDHSLVAKLVTTGELKLVEIYSYPYRNIVTRFLGMEPEIEADLFSRKIKSEDVFLLCSDGLWEMIRNDQIQKILEEAETPQTACEQLVQIANLNGGADNISVIVVKVRESGTRIEENTKK